MNLKSLIACSLIVGLTFACDKEEVTPTPTPSTQTFSFEFTNSQEGWVGDFADYPVGEEVFYELGTEHDQLPDPLDGNDGAIKQTGNNHSDDLFMFLKKEIDGLKANQRYEVTFDIQFATDAATGSVGIGGSPAESVYLKAGATNQEPDKLVGQDNHYRMNIDKNNQSQGGKDMKVIGDFANGTDQFVYTLKDLKSNALIEVQSDDNGKLWVIVGTDSGYEGTTTIYWNKIEVTFKEL